MQSISPEFLLKQVADQAPLLACEQPARGEDKKPAQAFTRITTDSRKVIPGALFIAIKGENHDGEAFIEAAFKAGARAVLAHGPCPDSLRGRGWYFQVADTLATFRVIARILRQSFRDPVIAVAGSVGKTTTKELLGSLLQGRFENLTKTQGSQNGFLGIPITLMDLRPETEIALIEIGIDAVGAMQSHMELVQPTHAIITALAPEHLEQLHDLPTVIREEMIALEWTARHGGQVFINLDDEHVRRAAQNILAPAKVQFTLDPKLKLSSAESSAKTYSGQWVADRHAIQLESQEYVVPLPGLHNARNFLGALAIALELGLEPAQIQRGLKKFTGAEGRSRIEKLASGVTVLCDYYNASPASTQAALEVLVGLPGPGRRFACLADMLELGPTENTLHQSLASSLMGGQPPIDFVYLYGERMRFLAETLRQTAAFKGKTQHFATKAELAQTLKSELKSGDIVLIKGSRGMKMEEIWENLKK